MSTVACSSKFVTTHTVCKTNGATVGVLEKKTELYFVLHSNCSLDSFCASLYGSESSKLRRYIDIYSV